jgi:hypothetical protein
MCHLQYVHVYGCVIYYYYMFLVLVQQNWGKPPSPIIENTRFRAVQNVLRQASKSEQNIYNVHTRYFEYTKLLLLHFVSTLLQATSQKRGFLA